MFIIYEYGFIDFSFVLVQILMITCTDTHFKAEKIILYFFMILHPIKIFQCNDADNEIKYNTAEK